MDDKVMFEIAKGLSRIADCMEATQKNGEAEPSTSNNNRMLQFPHDCKDCFFQHKCKKRKSVDYAYNGLECANIWEHYRQKL